MVKKDIQSLQQLVSVARWQVIKAILIIPMIIVILVAASFVLKLTTMFALVADSGAQDLSEMASTISLAIINVVEEYIFNVAYAAVFFVPIHVVLARSNQRDLHAYSLLGAIVGNLWMGILHFLNWGWEFSLTHSSIAALMGAILSILFWLFVRKLPKRSEFILSES